ncbi:RmlC-like cupin [Acaromyces ingoldii]|uniref:RmlC-like cupin n=1 Tax=Acaromyces ingoldii TaxID=215250 RepID=A0A316YDU5_9BASI|nr:RmlC-like cupin [Acaromyces ingoldii]PWN87301.1 RmlC-like cupin [Acaromyces ingoldii]
MNGVTEQTNGQAKATNGDGAHGKLRLTPASQTHRGRNPAGQSYVLSQCSGESLYIPSSNSIMRLAAGKEQTAGSFAIATSQGAASEAIVPHMHKDAHDTFLCLRGSLQVWCNNESRVLYPGDFASVPPMAIHSYAQRSAAHNDFCGVISPGGWEEFFRVLGDAKEDDVLFPTGDKAPFPVQRFVQALQEGHDVIPQPQHALVDATPFSDKDETLPQDASPYFLKADTGPRYLLAGQQLELLCGKANSAGRFSMAWLEGSSQQPTSFLGPDARVAFNSTSTYLRIIDGGISLTVNGQRETLNQGEAAVVAAGDAFRIDFSTPYGRVLLASGTDRDFQGGLEELFIAHGQRVDKNVVLGQELAAPDQDTLQRWASTVGARLV